MIVSCKKIQFPNKCLGDKCPVPKNARFGKLGQGSICIRCPIFCCEGHRDLRIVEPEWYRDDWAMLWKKFFDGEIVYEKFDLPLMEKNSE
jgi:hypothetical protein